MLAVAEPRTVQPNLVEVERYAHTPYAHARALHENGYGNVSVGRKSRRTGAVLQRPLPVERAIEYAKRLRGREDLYISLNRFGAGGLGTRNLISISALYADLDHYKVRGLEYHHPYEIVEQALDKLRTEGIPAPTIAMSSGRGVQLVWQFDPVKPSALPKWRRAARRINEVLREFGAEAAVGNDPARVLRLAGTTNSANGARVEPLLPVGPVYKFKALCDEILPRTGAEIYNLRREYERRRGGAHEPTQGPQSPPPGYNGQTVNEGKIRDVHRNRGHRGGRAMNDNRRTWMLHYSVAAAWVMSPEALREDCRRVGAEVAGWSERQTDTALGTVFRRAEAAARGETITFNGKQVDPRYRYSTDRIIDDLGITPAEMREMEVLIDADERRRRRREKAENRRRREGCEPRADYEGRAAHRRTQARRLAAGGSTRAEIAEALGVSKPSVTGYLKDAAEVPASEGGSKSVSEYAPVGGRRPRRVENAAAKLNGTRATGESEPPESPETAERDREAVAERATTGIRAAETGPPSEAAANGQVRPSNTDSPAILLPAEVGTEEVLAGRAGALEPAQAGTGERPEIPLGASEPGQKETPPAGIGQSQDEDPPSVGEDSPANPDTESIRDSGGTLSPRNPSRRTISDWSAAQGARAASNSDAGQRLSSGPRQSAAEVVAPEELHYRRLVRHLKHRVDTPSGGGELWQAFRDRVGVLLDTDRSRVTFLAPTEISPAGEAAADPQGDAAAEPG